MKICTLLACSLLLLPVGTLYAATYNLPTMKGDRVISQFPEKDSHLITVTRVDYPDIEAKLPITLVDVARRFNLGQEEIVRLNPSVDRWSVKEGETVRLPNKRILPDTPHNGVTLNISEFRMYYYPPNTGQVMSFAHGIGRQDWKTPLGQTKIIRKIKDPVWNPPASIRREHAADGDPLPAVVPAGPHNPLGTRALYLALPGEYRIHGTDIDKIYGIGMQITHGCVRMYPEDIEHLYNYIAVGTPVYLVKQPIKVGWLNNVLYIEAHPDLEGENMGKERRYQVSLELMRKHNGGTLPEFDQKALNDALEKLDGEPVALYERLPPLDGGTVIPPEPMSTVPSAITPDPMPTNINIEPADPNYQPIPETPVAPPPEPVSKLAPAKAASSKVAATATKAAPKTAVKTLAKSETIKPAVKIAAAKVATKPVLKAENKVATKTAVKATGKADTKIATKATGKAEAKVAIKAVAKAEPNVTAKPTAKASTAKVGAKPASSKALPKTAAKYNPKLPATISALAWYRLKVG